MTLLRGLLSAGLTLPSLAHFYGYVSPKRGVPGKQVRLIVRSPAKGTYFIEFWDDIAGVGRLVTRYTDAQVDLLKGTRNVTKKNGVVIAFDAEDVRQAVAYLLRQEEKARSISGLRGLSDVHTMRLKELQEQAALALAKAAQHAKAGHGALARVWRNAAARLQRELEARLVELR